MKAACLALLLAGCVAVTINVSFPQEKLDSAASSIEDMVRSPGGPPAGPEPKPAPKSEKQGMLTPSPGWAAWLLPSPAEAQRVPDLKIRTPEVMAAIESRRKRFPEYEALAGKGCVGETNQGLVEARPGEGCPPTLGQFIAAENGDRMFIYKTLVEQNQMAAADIAKVQAGFAKSNREKAAPGTWIQLENGQWTKK
jgi:uncharacterized protein YdbL (DUF1318 family)